MVWVRRSTLWGWEERKKGNTTVPFFSGDKVLLDRKALDAPEEGWGQGSPVALQQHGPGLPQDEATLQAPQQQRPVGYRKLLSGMGPEQISCKPDHVPLQTRFPNLKSLPSGSALMEKFICHNLAHRVPPKP